MVSTTPRTRFSRLPRLRSALAAGLVLTLLTLTLAGCLHVAVGDPENSSVDPALTGAWLWEQGTQQSHMFLIHGYDERTALVQLFSYEMNAGRVEPKSTSSYKAWLTEIGGHRFVTLKPLSAAELALPESERSNVSPIKYLVGRLALTDDGETLTARPLAPNSDLLNNAENRAAAERVIQQHVDDDAIYVDGEGLTLRKLGPYDTEEIRSVLETFHAD